MTVVRQYQVPTFLRRAALIVKVSVLKSVESLQYSSMRTVPGKRRVRD